MEQLNITYDVKERHPFWKVRVMAILLVIASLAFDFYISKFGNYGATYGSLGAVMILMLWLYIAGLVLLIGSEINAVLEHSRTEGKSEGEKEV